MYRLILTFVCLLSCGAFGGDLAPDIGDELARARKEWQNGDALGARAPAAQNTNDLEKILKEQDSAYEAAEAAYKAALAKDPRNRQALADFGRFAFSRRDFSAARTRLEASISPAGDEVANDSKPRTKLSGKLKAVFAAPEIADILRMLGGLCERAGDMSLALDYYNQAMQLNPDDARNRISLAIANCADGRPEDAANLLKPWDKTDTSSSDKNVDRPPANPAVRALGLYTLALALEETGFPEDALRIYHSALQTAIDAGVADESGVSDHANMAIARLEDIFDAWQAESVELAKENEARKSKHLEPLPGEREEFAASAQACELGLRYKANALNDPTFVDALKGDQSTLEKHPSFESFLAATEAFKDAIRRNSRFARAHYELALCDMLLRRYGHARSLLEAAELYSPNNLAILNALGQVLLELGQWEDAAKVFTKVLSLDGECGWANYGLARACVALQKDARQCQTGLDALERAWQLGVRDRLMFPVQVLVLNDGSEIEGRVKEEGDVYIVEQRLKKTAKFTKAEVKEVRQKQGLQEQLKMLVDRFARGEKPQAVPIYRPNAPRRQAPTGIPNPWSGGNTVFDR